MLEKDPRSIQSMFARIAPRYDRANHVLSMQVDHYWRRVVARALLPSPGLVLDLAAGTGDLTVELARRGGHRVVSADFTFEMLLHGREKLARHAPSATSATADALRLPFRSSTFDAVTVAFGIRNFASAEGGLREIHRVLRSGGRAGILEFSRPKGPFGALFNIYSKRVIPALGGLITGHRSPYEYLPESVQQFPEADAFLDLMRDADFHELTARRLTGGIATFYSGRKP